MIYTIAGKMSQGFKLGRKKYLTPTSATFENALNPLAIMTMMRMKITRFKSAVIWKSKENEICIVG